MTDVLARLTTSLADRYRIERELGQGGMATVYLAQDVRHQRKVALKVLRPELAAILGGERFLQEIRTTANLQHPHILPLHDSGEVDGVVYYVMPYIEGESLRDRLRREHQMPVEEAVRVAREVADALEYAHQHGVVHRDIKPENILLQGGHALVADFGIALAAARSDGGARMTETGMSLGTPHYMAPEQAMGERDITAKADIYALGCVLYEMLAGEPPFTGPTAQAIVARVMTEQPRSLTLQRRTIPANVEEAVQRCLEKLPADRFSSAARLAELLANPDAAAPRHTGALIAGPVRRYAAAAVVPWALALVALAAAAWGFSRRPDQILPVMRFGVTIPDSVAMLPDPPYGSIALSPDGRQLVYVGRSTRGQRQLFVRQLDALDPRPMPGTEGAASPFYSPDGQWVGFFSEGRLKKVALAGGPPLTIANAEGRGGTWANGRIVFTSGANTGLLSVLEGGGPVDTITVPARDSGETSHRWPVFLPGGDAVLFTVQYGARYMLAVVTLGDGAVKLLVDAGMSGRFSPTGHLIYASDAGALLAVPFDSRRLAVTGSPVSLLEGVLVNQRYGSAEFALSGTGTLAYLTGSQRRSLALVDRGGNERLIRVLENADGPRFSPDGRRIALASIEQGHLDVRVYDTDAGTLARLSFDGSNIQPEWTPDGTRVAFSSTMSNQSYRLYSTEANGSGQPVALTPPGPPTTEHVWTPDGRSLVVRQNNIGTLFDLYVVSLDSPLTIRPYLTSAFNEFMPAISPDGHWLAYVSNESGPNEVYVRAFPVPGGVWQVSTGGGTEPRWSRDGRELFYRSGDSVISAAVSARPTFSVGARRTLFVQPLYATGINHAGYDVHPSGGRFVMVKSETQRSSLVVTVNFADELRRRTSGRQ